MNRNWLWSVVILILLASGSYVIYMFLQHAAMPEGFLYGNGHIEGTEVLVQPEVAGRLQAVQVEEGDEVGKDQIIAVIDPEISQNRLRSLQAQIKALETSRESIQSQLQLWQHHLQVAERQVKRIRTLMESGSASQYDLDQAQNGMQEARTQLQTLKSQAEGLESEIKKARAEANIAASRLEQTEIVSPTDGVLMVRSAETGEVVRPGQTLGLIVNLDKLDLKVYVPGNDLGKVKLGNPARVRVDAFPDTYYHAEITHIDDFAQFTPRDIHLPEERVRMVYGVELSLRNPDHRLKPGMPADAWIRWDKNRPWPAHLPVPGR